MREAFAEMTDLIKTISKEIPKTIKDNSHQIGIIDMKVAKMTQQVKNLVFTYLKNLKTFNKNQKVTMYQEIQKIYAEIEKMADEKVRIAQKTYATIDESITSMDKINDKMSHEIEAAKKEAVSKKEKNESASTSKKPTGSVSRKRKSTTIPNAKAAKFAESESFANGVQEAPAELYGTLDMPINPFEPTYCKCKGVSFGQMIACDNTECEFEWFHFNCVGLTEAPKGAWFCDKCRPTHEKKK